MVVTTRRMTMLKNSLQTQEHSTANAKDNNKKKRSTHEACVHNSSSDTRKKQKMASDATKALCKGIVHAFKSKSPSSMRTVFAKDIIDNSISKLKNTGTAKVRNGLKHAVPVDTGKMDEFRARFMQGKNAAKKLFFSGKDNVDSECNVGRGGVWVSVKNDPAINVIDTKDGMIHYFAGSNEPVFVLLRRTDSIKGMKQMDKFLGALDHVERQKPESSSVRGGGKQVRYEKGTKGANYVTTGVAAKRAGRGLYKKDIGDADTERIILAMNSYIQHKCEGYIDPKLKKALRKVMNAIDLDLAEVKTMKEQKNAMKVDTDKENDEKKD